VGAKAPAFDLNNRLPVRVRRDHTGLLAELVPTGSPVLLLLEKMTQGIRARECLRHDVRIFGVRLIARTDPACIR
jgi:hypothetical protein